MKDNKILKQQFFNSLKLGTGKAYLIARANPEVDFSAYIIKGAFFNYGYDRQAEGSRAIYIYNLIQQSAQKEKIIKIILKKLPEEKKDDDYRLDQLCDLAVMLYKDGYKAAKEALYNRFEKNDLAGYENCGQEQLIRMDGLNGLLKVAEQSGRRLLKNSKDYETNWLVDSFNKKQKKIDAWAELEKAAVQNEYIAAYLNSVKEDKIDYFGKRKRVKISYSSIKERINKGGFVYIPPKAIRDLSKKDIQTLALEFLNEKDKEKQKGYLRVFKAIKFPFDYTPILKIVIRNRSKTGSIPEFASSALKFFQGKDIRAVALDKIRTTKNPSDYLDLLISNYKKGDHLLLLEVINRTDDYDFIHSLAYGIIDIYAKNSVKECKKPLEALYHKMNCGIHREDLVEIMDRNNVLSDKLFQELQYDSHISVRKFYKRKKRIYL